jgi:hypothetical protein
MKPLSPLEHERKKYSRMLAAYTFQQWFAAHSEANNQQTQTTSSSFDSNGRQAADERPHDSAEQDSTASQSQSHEKQGPHVIDFAVESSGRGRRPGIKNQSNLKDFVN